VVKTRYGVDLPSGKGFVLLYRPIKYSVVWICNPCGTRYRFRSPDPGANAETRFAELFVNVHTDAFMDGGVLIWKVHIVFIIFVKMEEYSPVQRDVQLNVIVLITYEIGGRGRRFVVKGYAVFCGKGESTGTGKAGAHETFRLFETGERVFFFI